MADNSQHKIKPFITEDDLGPLAPRVIGANLVTTRTFPYPHFCMTHMDCKAKPGGWCSLKSGGSSNHSMALAVTFGWVNLWPRIVL
jgi:hypothetical protein